MRSSKATCNIQIHNQVNKKVLTRKKALYQDLKYDGILVYPAAELVLTKFIKSTKLFSLMASFAS